MNSCLDTLKHFFFLIEEWLDSSRERVLRVHDRNLRLTRKLGEGGYAFVYLAQDTRTAQLFAVKRVRIQLAEQGVAFSREVRAHHAVRNDPNVVRLLDHIVLDGSGGAPKEGVLLLPYYRNGTAQDLVDGADATKQPLPLSTVMKLFNTICEGLLAFHTQPTPMAFRDLKPANILLDSNGTAVLTDLGSVAVARITIRSRKEALQLEEVAAETCSAPYRAPELFAVPSECSIDERTDVWSLGCTLFALCYARPPFEGTQTAAMGTVPFPSETESKRYPYPPEMVQMIKYLLVVDLQERPTVQDAVNRAKELGLL